MPSSSLYLAADPLSAISSLLFYRGAWVPALLLPALLLLASAIFGRIFCGWACPVGFLSDITGSINRLILPKPLRWQFDGLQVGVLVAVLLASLLTLDVLSFTDPLVILQRSAYLLWSGTGLPVILLLIIIGSMVVPRLWCRLCPLGALLGVVSVASPFGRQVNEQCTRCMKCRKACTSGAISKDNMWDSIACTRCLDCERACPENALSFAASMPSPGIANSRRSFLAAGALLGFFAVSKGVASMLTNHESPIRPPGSLVESKFNIACSRCESCAKACLGQVIRPAGLDMGLERYYTPVLDFEKGKCERCGTYGSVCPTGAILSPREDTIKLGTAAINEKTCIAWSLKKKCLICAEVCPVHAVSGADTLKPAINGEACIGCGSCQLHCPVDEKAVTVTSAGERRRDE